MRRLPITMLIKPASSLCNMRCGYCFYADVSARRDVASYGMMDLGTLESLTKKALSCARDYCCFIFQGGEPTLAGLAFYESLVAFQRRHNVRGVDIFNAIQTNGYAVDGEWAAFFAKNGFLVGLSIDGAKDMHDAARVDAFGAGTYERSVATAALLDARGAAYNVLCVVTGHVARRPRRAYSALRRFRNLQFTPCIDGLGGEKSAHSLDDGAFAYFLKETFDLYYGDFMSGSYVSVRDFDNYVSMLQGNPPESCGIAGACGGYFAIESDGGVYPCDYYVLDRYRMGDVGKDTFDGMAASAAAAAFVAESRAVHPRCAGCKWHFLCRGGCRRNREPALGGALIASNKALDASRNTQDASKTSLGASQNLLDVSNAPLNVRCGAYEAFFEYAFPRLEELARAVPHGRGLPGTWK